MTKLKRKLDLHGKSTLNRGTKNFCTIGGKNRNMAGLTYIFKKENLKNKSAKNLRKQNKRIGS